MSVSSGQLFYQSVLIVPVLLVVLSECSDSASVVSGLIRVF